MVIDRYHPAAPEAHWEPVRAFVQAAADGTKLAAVYLVSPSYFGATADIASFTSIGVFGMTRTTPVPSGSRFSR